LCRSSSIPSSAWCRAAISASASMPQGYACRMKSASYLLMAPKDDHQNSANRHYLRTRTISTMHPAPLITGIHQQFKTPQAFSEESKV
ncbi:MAG: hypothetical protein ACYCQM_11055, partial [Acidithiobacillus sp.]